MASLQRRVLPARHALIETSTLWRAGLAVLGVGAFIVARACGYEFDTVTSYVAYFILYVALPGAVAMYLFNRGPVSLAHAFALGLPTGFALEIFTYLGLSALDAKLAYVWMPVGWLTLALATGIQRGEWPVRVRISGHHAGIFAGLCLAFLGTALMAAGQMFSESPLVDGLPQRAIFHDWVYLVSRAAVIKNNWPLDDPSLSGTPLQYHYFMMVHAVAASWTTGVELTAVMLRLLYVPLGGCSWPRCSSWGGRCRAVPGAG